MLDDNPNCYLTLSCMVYYKDKFDYNCYQLRVLNWLKDNYLTKEDILEYEEISPIIVDKIDEEVYYDIFINVILKIVLLIEEGEYKDAYFLYKSSLNELKNKILDVKKY